MPEENAKSSTEIQDIQIPTSSKSHVSLGTLAAVIVFTFSLGYGFSELTRVEKFKAEVSQKNEDIVQLASENERHKTKLLSLTEINSKLLSKTKSPISTSPSSGKTILGDHVEFKWDINPAIEPTHPQYTIEVKSFHNSDSFSQLLTVQNPKTHRMHYQIPSNSFGEIQWRIRLGSRSDIRSNNWSTWSNFEIYYSLVDRIKNKKEIRVAVDPTAFGEFNVRQPDGKLTGFEVELLEWVIKNLGRNIGIEGLKPVYIETTWTDLFEGVNLRKYDLAFSTISKSKSREKKYPNLRFSWGYYDSRQILIVRPDFQGSFPALLKNSKVGVLNGTTNEKVANHMASKYSYIIDSDNEHYGDLYRKLEDGTIQVGIVDEPLVKRYLGSRIKKIGPYLDEHIPEFFEKEFGSSKEQYAFAVGREYKRNNQKNLLELIDALLGSTEGQKKIKELESSLDNKVAM